MNLMKSCRQKIAKLFFLLLIGVTMGIGSPAFALSIDLTDIGGTPDGATGSASMTGTQRAAFEEAAGLWESLFVDDVTVNIDIQMDDLGDGGIIGQAGSTRADVSYVNVKTALFADASSLDDAIATSNLQTTTFVNTIISSIDNPGTEIHYNYQESVNDTLWVNTANLKALGLLGDTTTTDAEITFNTQFDFDYDRSDGITSNTMDFVGVAAHEIGHALGFVSGVDILDYLTDTYPNTINGTQWSDSLFKQLGWFSVLDLYRYSADSLDHETYGTTAGSIGGINDWGVGGTSFFSIDGGLTNTADLFSTGAYSGDGRQASHWKDNLGLGLMDPTFATGELGVITGLDIQAFDVIGWDLDLGTPEVPEPGTMLLFFLGLLGVAGMSRRKRS